MSVTPLWKKKVINISLFYQLSVFTDIRSKFHWQYSEDDQIMFIFALLNN